MNSNDHTSSPSTSSGPLRRFFAAWPEIPWLLAALAVWWVMGLLLEPLTASYGPEFLHKAVITAARMIIAIAFTELAVMICFPTIRQWVRAGSFRACFESPELTAEQMLRLRLTTTVHLAIFAAVMVSLSL